MQIAVLETVGGSVVTVEASVNARYGYDIHTEVTGTEGTVSLTPPYGLSVRRDRVDGREVDDDFVARFVDAYRIELADWVRGIRDGPSDRALGVGRVPRERRRVRRRRVAARRRSRRGRPARSAGPLRADSQRVVMSVC